LDARPAADAPKPARRREAPRSGRLSDRSRKSLQPAAARGQRATLLPLSPEGEELSQGAGIRDEQIDGRLRSGLVARELLFVDPFQAGHATDCGGEVLDRTVHLEDQEASGASAAGSARNSKPPRGHMIQWADKPPFRFSESPIPDKFRQFTPKRIAGARETSEVLICISADNRAGVDDMVDRAGGAGGQVDPCPKRDHGFMCGRSFEDPDGHIWEVMWMDLAAAQAAMAGSSNQANA
jgi:hypothetical protein